MAADVTPEQLEAHALAELFPSMTPDEFNALVEDIERHGLIEPIVLFEGQILDGRHRYRACLECGARPRFERFEGSEDEALARSVALNLHRRQLSTAQKAALGVTLKQFEAARAAERMRAGVNQHTPSPMEIFPGGSTGTARDRAGALVSVSGRTIDEAEKIAQAAPDVFEKIRQGQYQKMTDAKRAARLEPELRAKVHARMDEGAAFKEALYEEMGEHDGDINNTPPEVIALARRVMGSIDLDPATNEAAQGAIGATRCYTREDNGLDQPWAGTVWCNPPYSHGLIEQFTDKIVDEWDRPWEDRAVHAMIVLTNASACARWWQRLGIHATRLAFPPARLQFWRAHAEQGSSNERDQSLFYFGPSPDEFDRVMREAGWFVCEPRGERR